MGVKWLKADLNLAEARFWALCIIKNYVHNVNYVIAPHLEGSRRHLAQSKILPLHNDPPGMQLLMQSHHSAG